MEPRTERLRLRTEAHRAVRAALVAGTLVRPDVCSRCGKTCAVQGHHPDYTKPLDVQWLCQPCHKREHYNDPRAIRPRCVKCRRLIYLWTIDNGDAVQTPDGPAHKKCRRVMGSLPSGHAKATGGGRGPAVIATTSN